MIGDVFTIKERRRLLLGLVGAFNKEKFLVGVFLIVKTD